MKRRRYGLLGVAAVILGHVVHMAILPVLMGSAALHQGGSHTVISWLLWVVTGVMVIRMVLRVGRHITVFWV